MTKEDSIKISAKPFIFISLLFIGFVVLGSVANYFRMKKRFNSLVDHSKVVYQAHINEIESLFKKEENMSDIKTVLYNINFPEKDVYSVDIIKQVGNTGVIYDAKDQYSDYDVSKSLISQDDIQLIQNYILLKDNKKFGYQKKLTNFYSKFYRLYYYNNKDFLISIIPINQTNDTVGSYTAGYFIMATSKIQPN